MLYYCTKFFNLLQHSIQHGINRMNDVNHTSYAWLLSLGSAIYAAVGERELQYLLADMPQFTHLPNAPVYCNQVFIWQRKIVPVMDLAQFILKHKAIRLVNEELIVLASFQSHTSTFAQYGAILLDAIPARIQVGDQQVCELPHPKTLWQQIATSCFQHSDKGPIPILDLNRIFLTPANG